MVKVVQAFMDKSSRKGKTWGEFLSFKKKQLWDIYRFPCSYKRETMVPYTHFLHNGNALKSVG